MSRSADRVSNINSAREDARKTGGSVQDIPDALGIIHTYKDFNEVLRSVELAGLATEVARLDAKFVIKDHS